MKLAIAAAASLLVAGVLPAQELSVGGKSPKGTLAVVSVPNAGSAWQGLSGSPLGRQLLNTMMTDVLPSTRGWGAFQSDRPAIETAIGFSLEPGKLFGPTVTGFDFYIADPEGKGPALLLNARFREISAPGLVLDRIKREAQASGGVGFGRAANTIEETTTAGRRTLFLPAFSLYLAHEGNLLLVSTSQEGLRSALNDEGSSYFAAASFLDPFGAIADEPHNAWVHGRTAEVAKLFGVSDVSLKTGTGETVAAVIDVRATHVKITQFVPRSGMTPSLLRYVANAPPADQLPVLSMVQQGAKAALATNHFNMDLLWDLAGETARAAGGQDAMAAMDEQSAGLKSVLGFDPRRDFLGNLGPELAVALNDFTMAEGAMVPNLDLVIIAGTRNVNRVQESMGNLEQFLIQSLAPADGSSSPATFQSETSGAATMRVFSHPAVEAAGFTPAYAFTSEGRFVLGTRKEGVARVIGGASALASNPAFADARRLMGANRNVDFFLSTGIIADLMKLGVPEAGFTPGEMELFALPMNVVQAIRSFSMNYGYTPRGQKVEVLFLM